MEKYSPQPLHETDQITPEVLASETLPPRDEAIDAVQREMSDLQAYINTEEIRVAEKAENPGWKADAHDLLEARLYAKRELRAKKERLGSLKAAWTEAGGDKIDEAEAVLNTFKTDANERVKARAALKESKNAFYSNLQASFAEKHGEAPEDTQSSLEEEPDDLVGNAQAIVRLQHAAETSDSRRLTTADVRKMMERFNEKNPIAPEAKQDTTPSTVEQSNEESSQPERDPSAAALTEIEVDDDDVARKVQEELAARVKTENGSKSSTETAPAPTKMSMANYGSGLTGLWDAQGQADPAKLSAHLRALAPELKAKENEAAGISPLSRGTDANYEFIGEWDAGPTTAESTTDLNDTLAQQTAGETTPRPQDIPADERERNAFLEQNASRFESNRFEKFAEHPFGTMKSALGRLRKGFREARADRKVRATTPESQGRQEKRRFPRKMIALVGTMAIAGATVAAYIGIKQNGSSSEHVDARPDRVAAAPAVVNTEKPEKQEATPPKFNKEARTAEENEGWISQLEDMGFTQAEIPSTLKKLLEVEDPEVREWVYERVNAEGEIEPGIARPGNIPVSVLESIQKLG